MFACTKKWRIVKRETSICRGYFFKQKNWEAIASLAIASAVSLFAENKVYLISFLSMHGRLIKIYAYVNSDLETESSWFFTLAIYWNVLQ